MTINVCYTSSASEVVHKVVNVIKTVNATIKENSSIINPRLILHNFSITDVNYLYIPLWKRYYYINEIVVLDAERVEVSARVDVLKSFAEDIKKCSAIIDKQSRANLSDKYIDDGSYVERCDKTLQSYAFPSGFTSQANILITAGGD